MIYAFALLFIIYEIYGLLNYEKIMSLLDTLNKNNNQIPSNTVDKNLFIQLFIIECSYLFFVFILFFTQYWMTSLILAVFAILVYGKRKNFALHAVDTVFSILALSLIFFL